MKFAVCHIVRADEDDKESEKWEDDVMDAFEMEEIPYLGYFETHSTVSGNYVIACAFEAPMERLNEICEKYDLKVDKIIEDICFLESL